MSLSLNFTITALHNLRPFGGGRFVFVGNHILPENQPEFVDQQLYQPLFLLSYPNLPTHIISRREGQGVQPQKEPWWHFLVSWLFSHLKKTWQTWRASTLILRYFICCRLKSLHFTHLLSLFLLMPYDPVINISVIREQENCGKKKKVKFSFWVICCHCWFTGSCVGLLMSKPEGEGLFRQAV